MNFLSIVLIHCGFSVMVLGMFVDLTIDHAWSILVLLLGIVCVAAGSIVYGLQHAALLDRLDRTEMPECPVLCGRNRPPESCICGGCRS